MSFKSYLNSKIFSTKYYKRGRYPFYILVLLVYFQNCGNFSSTGGSPVSQTTSNTEQNTPPAEAPKICVPAETLDCNAIGGNGVKTCNAEGTAYGACEMNNCDLGFTLTNKQCVESCFTQLSGDGSANNPFQIKNATDFFCMNDLNANRGDRTKNNWALKTNLVIDATTYPVYKGKELRTKDYLQFSLISSFTRGVFDGEYHQIKFTVDCSLESNKCLNDDGSPYPKKDIAVFGYLRASTIQNLFVDFHYVDIDQSSASGATGRARTQYASGLALVAQSSYINQVSAVGETQEGPQVVGGLITLDGTGGIGNGNSFINKSRASISVIAKSSAQRSNTGALVGVADMTEVRDSYGELSGKLNNPYTGTTSGLFYAVANDATGAKISQLNIERAYVKVLNTATPTNCLPVEFAAASLSLTKITNMNRVFWTGPASCDKKSIYANAYLPLSTADAANLATSMGWDPTVWEIRTDALPSLKWFNLKVP